MIPPVDPILFTIGRFTVHWYGLLVVTGILLGAQVAAYLAKKAGEDPDRIWDMLMVAVITGIIGARIEYVIVPPHWIYYQEHLANAFYVWEGGLRIYGAIVGGALGVLRACHEDTYLASVRFRSSPYVTASMGKPRYSVLSEQSHIHRLR